MKKNILLIMVLLGCWLVGCQDEEVIQVELEHYRRTYDTTSSDPVIKYISDYYYKYGKTIILDPDTADYVYNFQNKNDLRMVDGKQARWEKSLNMVRELFLNSYSSKTIRDYFPFNVIIADSIQDYSGMTPKFIDLSFASNFIAFTANEGKLQLTENQKYDYSLKMHLLFLSSFCVSTERINVSNSFYAPSSTYYGSQDYTFETLEKAYEVGFVEIVKGGWWYPCPKKADDLAQWLKFMLTIPDDELKTILEKYDVMKIKYQVLSETLSGMGIDFRNLVYKKKTD